MGSKRLSVRAESNIVHLRWQEAPAPIADHIELPAPAPQQTKDHFGQCPDKLGPTRTGRLVVALQSGQSSVLWAQLKFQSLFTPDLFVFVFSQLVIYILRIKFAIGVPILGKFPLWRQRRCVNFWLQLHCSFRFAQLS